MWSGLANSATGRLQAGLSDRIEAMIRRGQRSRLGLSNRAITAYRRLNGATASKLAARTLA
jgi:hypothetical protein